MSGDYELDEKFEKTQAICNENEVDIIFLSLSLIAMNKLIYF